MGNKLNTAHKICAKAANERNYDLPYEQWVMELNPNVHDVLILCDLMAQVWNGGFEQWYSNGYGGAVLQCLEALLRLNSNAAKVVHDLVQQADNFYTTTNRNNEWEYETMLWRFDDLDTAFYTGVDNLLADDVERLAVRTVKHVN